MTTSDRDDPRLQQIRPDGQQEAHIVMPEAERLLAGQIRPVRRSYRHVGVRPRYPLTDLTGEQHERYDKFGYVKFEAYPEDESPATGRYWTQKQLDSGCGSVTTMGLAIAETYSVDPTFYGATFCAVCRDYFPVGAEGEFVWDGTNEKVGT